MVHANVKNYRWGLFNFRLNIVYLIPGLPERHLPVSIIPIVSFLMIMDKVFVRQSKPGNRLTVAISESGFLSHMISCFLVDTFALSEEPFLTFNIPLAWQQTFPHAFPDDPQTALTWKREAPYWALVQNKIDTYVLSVVQFEHYLGSSKYQICSEAFPTQIRHPLVLRTFNILALMLI